MFCRNCGAKISDKAVMCVHCGEVLAVRNVPPFRTIDKRGFPKYERTIACGLSTAQVDDRMCNLSRYGILFELAGRNVTTLGFDYYLTACIGVRSFGEEIYVSCKRNGEKCSVNVFSKCVFCLQLIDFWKNRSNVNRICRMLQS